MHVHQTSHDTYPRSWWSPYYLKSVKQKEHMHYILGQILQTDSETSENREHLKIFRNVDCVLTNYNKVQDTQANLTIAN